MPIYEYRCESCDHELEALVRGGREPESCPSCEGKLARKISRAGVIFKGSGFYVTDSRGSSGGGAKSKSSPSGSDTSSKDSGGSGGDSKSETKSSDTKSSDSKASEAKSSSSDSGSSSKSSSP